MKMKNIPLLICCSPRSPRAFLTLMSAGVALSFAAPAQAQRSSSTPAGQQSGQSEAQAQGALQWHSGDEWFSQKTASPASSEGWVAKRPSTGAPFHVWDPQTQTWVIIDRNLVEDQYQAAQRGEIPQKVDPQRIQRLTPQQHEQLEKKINPQRFTIQQQEDQALHLDAQGQAGLKGQPGQPGQQGHIDAQQAKSDLKQQAKQARDAAKEASRQQAQQQALRQQPEDLKPMAVQGRIEGFREMGIKDDSGLWQDHTLVRIRLDNGTEAVVDIGRRMDLEDIDLQQGQQIQINGHQGQVDNKQVVVADQIQSGQRTFNIARDDKKREISGRITDVNKIDLNKQGEDSLLVRLKMDDGSAVVVDLGKDISLEDLDLEKNSQVRVRGEREFIDGKSILVAEQISVDGEATQVPQQLPEIQQNQQLQQQRQQQRQQQQEPQQQQPQQQAQPDQGQRGY